MQIKIIVRSLITIVSVAIILGLIVSWGKIKTLTNEKIQLKQELDNQETLSMQLSNELNIAIDESEMLSREVIKSQAEIESLNAEILDLASTNTALGAAIEVIEEENKELKRAEKYTFNGRWKYSYSEEDVKILAGVMYGENWISGRWEMMLTGSVVLNRIISPKFPNTIKEVVYQIDGEYEQYAPRTKRLIGSDLPPECYELAELLLKYGPVCPEQVVYQAHFNQGNVYWDWQGEQFCYKEEIRNEKND